MTASLAAAFAAARASLESTPDSVAPLTSLSDEELLTTLSEASGVRRLLDARLSLLAGEAARRSAPSLAHSGLAQRRGHRTADELVRVATGSSRREARDVVQAGVMLVGAEAAEAGAGGASAAESPGALELPAGLPAVPEWAQRLVEPVRRGALSIGALQAIRSGLGEPTATVTTQVLRGAVEALLAEAPDLDTDRLYRRARGLRDELDAEGVAEREAERRSARSLRLHRLPDGMSRATWLLDPESAAVVADLFDRATSPRRGGPTFVGERDAAVAQRMLDDERTPEQYASDAVLALLVAGADADSSQLLGTGAPSVRVLVTANDLRNGSGTATVEGQTAPLSLPTVERMLCTGTHTPILISGTGQPLDVGRTRRHFTIRQRKALAARDGGCRWVGCERPPSWTEAHHIDPWATHGGRTDVADGILLCRHHHLLVHNNGWRIRRRAARPDEPPGDQYEAIPPPSHGVQQTPLDMPSRSEPLRRALHPKPARAA
ncbi:HNH endonuclease signature motif containing protein [Chryseoglobus sp. 28M-23]|uniref:HNH endonuclease signature motif containing protein n=1 Tax=Chryseoglobus sp. 28M-23 TaxID=2772253 RepID=UPI001746B39D|nr:HNH endonuclease signature motif containing protein [Chryseoglobus sp. 28M-23]QOD93261.1 DUF222 domain-containing protein [Chryseoglobus sp. 28M-23]